jgi:signal transduction histidine kinase
MRIIAGNTEFGLNIVKQMAIGHGWDVEIVDSEGGARVEITGITFRPIVCE